MENRWKFGPFVDHFLEDSMGFPSFLYGYWRVFPWPCRMCFSMVSMAGGTLQWPTSSDQGAGEGLGALGREWSNGKLGEQIEPSAKLFNIFYTVVGAPSNSSKRSPWNTSTHPPCTSPWTSISFHEWYIHRARGGFWGKCWPTSKTWGSWDKHNIS